MGVQGGYVTYRVNTQTSMPSYPRSGSAVRRRFRDFVVRHLSCLKPCQASKPSSDVYGNAMRLGLQSWPFYIAAC